jgi:hypothetical protein
MWITFFSAVFSLLFMGFENMRRDLVVTTVSTSNQLTVTTERAMAYSLAGGVSVGLLPFSVFFYMLNPHPYWIATGLVSLMGVWVWGVIISISLGYVSVNPTTITQRIKTTWTSRTN